MMVSIWRYRLMHRRELTSIEAACRAEGYKAGYAAGEYAERERTNGLVAKLLADNARLTLLVRDMKKRCG